jgi:hypothetical protein
MGSECEYIMLALSDGRVTDIDGNDMGIMHRGKVPVFSGNMLFSAIHLQQNAVKCKMYGKYGCEDAVKKIETSSLCEIAVGLHDSSYPFVVWMK